MSEYTNEDNSKDRERFKLLMEYDFYIGEDEEEYEPEGEMINEEPPEMDGEDVDDTEGEEIDAEPESEESESEEPEPEMDVEPEAEESEPEMEMEPEMDMEPEGVEDEVELDVTDLVQGTQEAQSSAEEANEKAEMLLKKLDNLTNSLDRMSTINDKIDDLENEMEKRNPTPEEKLEMRSLSSYPYNLKLTDFWSEKEGNYDVMNQDEDGEKEYVLTQDDVDRDFNPMEIKDSFKDEDFDNNNTF